MIERTFGWLMQHRRLAMDCEALPQRSRAMVHWAMADKTSRELSGESTPNLANRIRRIGQRDLNIDQMLSNTPGGPHRARVELGKEYTRLKKPLPEK